MNLKEQITKNIALMIKTSSKNQTQIAREMGVSNQAITDYVQGNAQPTLTGFVRLCQVLDCTYEDILGRL